MTVHSILWSLPRYYSKGLSWQVQQGMALLMLCLYMTNDEFSISGSLVLVVSGYNGGLKDFSQVVDISTGATCTNPPAGVNYPFAMNTGVGTTINGVPLICGGYAG